jgi:hypothetical protein
MEIVEKTGIGSVYAIFLKNRISLCKSMQFLSITRGGDAIFGRKMQIIERYQV